MQEADNSRRDDNRALRGPDPPAAWFTTDLPNDDTRARPHDASPRGLRHQLRSGGAWLTKLVERARTHLSEKRRMSDSSATSAQSPIEIAVTAPIVSIAAEDVIRRMKCGERVSFVDARTIDECIQSPGRIERSVRMTVSEVGERLKALPRERTVVTYCTWPEEEASSLVALELTRLGVADVHPLAGGLAAWRAAGGPVEQV